MNTNVKDQNQALTCNLTAISSTAREEHIITAPQLFQTVQEVQELSDGYAFRFLNEPDKFMAIAKYIENERLCCPFFDFELEIKPNHGKLWLRLTGGDGVKDLLKSTLLEKYENKNDIKKLIQTAGDAHFDELIEQTVFPDLSSALSNSSNE